MVFRHVRGSGVVETRFIDFENKEGRRFDGQCCDESGGWGWFSSSSDDCSTPCDHSFNICLGNITESSSMASCEFGKTRSKPVGENRIVFNGNIGDLPNPLKFRFNTWPGVVKLKVDVLDDDEDEGGYDFVDHYEYQYSTDRMTRELDAPTKTLQLSGSRSRVNVELKVFCDVNYYGSDCTIYCEPSDDDTGHNTCDPLTGQRVCRFGWSGDDCLTNIDDCIGHRCYDGATCIDGLGFYTCVCPPGRTGLVCNAEINECASFPCQNGGTCFDLRDGFTCTCTAEWTGHICDTPVLECTPGFCLNGNGAQCVDFDDGGIFRANVHFRGASGT
nr:hypothetical protein BaRGS_022067 [Batillaria attramentaria]